jgi:hypothetical protein
LFDRVLSGGTPQAEAKGRLCVGARTSEGLEHMGGRAVAAGGTAAAGEMGTKAAMQAAAAHAWKSDVEIVG